MRRTPIRSRNLVSVGRVIPRINFVSIRREVQDASEVARVLTAKYPGHLGMELPEVVLLRKNSKRLKLAAHKDQIRPVLSEFSVVKGG